jgi:hypothetical protein
MKRIVSSGCIFLIISFLSISCDDLGVVPDEVLFIEGQDILVDFTIHPVDVPGYHIFKEETFHENLDSLFLLYNFSADRLESVKLVSAEVEITDPGDSISLDCLDMVKITIYTAELGEVTVAENLEIPKGVTTADLGVIEGNMKDYLESDEYILTVYGILNARIYQQFDLKARIKYKYSIAQAS